MLALTLHREFPNVRQLAWGLFLPGDEVVVDFTVFSERTALRVYATLDPSRISQINHLSLEEVESKKVSLYKTEDVFSNKRIGS